MLTPIETIISNRPTDIPLVLSSASITPAIIAGITERIQSTTPIAIFLVKAGSYCFLLSRTIPDTPYSVSKLSFSRCCIEASRIP